MDDNLRSLRNNFYLGHYDKVIEEAQDGNAAEKVYYYRALLEKEPKAIFKQVANNSPTAHQAVKLLATAREAATDMKEVLFETVAEWLSDDILRDDPTLQLVAAQMYFEEENYKDAMKCVANAGENLEKLAMQAQILLKMDRLDLASKTVRNMADVDDDDPLTQLATAWLYVCQGGDKVTEASFLLQELVDKFGPSIQVLASQAVCQIHLGNHSNAFSHLKQARQMAMQANEKASTETLVNSIVCMLHMHKAEIVPKVRSELASCTSKSAKEWLAHNEEMEAMFDKHAKNFS